MTERGDRITFTRVSPITTPVPGESVPPPITRWPPIPVKEITVERPLPPRREAMGDWQERMREAMLESPYFDALWARTPTPPLSWWRRLRDRAAYRVYTMRDRLARWIAPWRGDDE